MKNLFIESEKHRIRVEKLVNLMTEKNYDPNKVEHFFPALIGVEVSSDEGEIWKIKERKSRFRLNSLLRRQRSSGLCGAFLTRRLTDIPFGRKGCYISPRFLICGLR